MFVLVALIIPIVVFPFFKLDGYTDPFYLRFTTPKQTSLIIGTSRAAQGIDPSIINKVLSREDIYNYSFTIVHSSFGATYLQSIQNKLKENTKSGIYIIAVDPWSISGPAANPNDSLSFPELNLALGKTNVVDINPNIFYLFQSYEKPLYNLLTDDKSAGVYLHNDGWLEVTTSMDSTSVAYRLNQKIRDYTDNNLPNYKFSQVRWDYLVKTIRFLKQHGEVYLVRLPVHPQMTAIENQLMPDFDNKIDYLSLVTKSPYKNFKMNESSYQYVDGNHLYKTSGAKVSAEIAEWIKECELN